ncbi:hypothetical protein B0T10DRAFT_559558 [Thelonectria olida]|uniref:Proteophosphoglycan 5 n=1 Tax=Thelonectria olida TaxID=1576542 RepID=A0A9P8W8B6_9HYPO|nr:hypothetical protein B0T10DRAFT_559558 [Thelonectria olida]
MYETSSQSTTTPARRHQGRGNGRAAAQKAYASENDVANVDFHRNPQTPQKPANDSTAHQIRNAKSTQRSRNKPRTASKNAPTSPESARPGRHTPPHPSSSMRSIAGQPFAGATFHHSPAPSALPLPSFMTNSRADSPSVKPSREILQEPSPPTDTEAPTPSRQASAPVAQESPLDFMFRAHREERERERRGSPASLRPSMLASDSPSAQSPFKLNSSQKPSSVSQSARSKPRYQPGMDTAELDGTPGHMVGPAFSTPYNERINAARTGNARPAAALQLPRQSSAPEPGEDPAEALKKYLFSGPSKSATVPVPAPPPASNAALNEFSSPRTQGQHAHGNDLFSMSNATGRPNDYREMEDSLRRLLKLDLTSEPVNTQRRLFS